MRQYIIFDLPINKLPLLQFYYSFTRLHTLIHLAINRFLNQMICYILNLFHFFSQLNNVPQISIHRATFQCHILPKDHSFIRLHKLHRQDAYIYQIHRLYHRPNVLRKHRHQRDKKSPFHLLYLPFKSLRIELYQATHAFQIHRVYHQFIHRHMLPRSNSYILDAFHVSLISELWGCFFGFYENEHDYYHFIICLLCAAIYYLSMICSHSFHSMIYYQPEIYYQPMIYFLHPLIFPLAFTLFLQGIF